MRPPRIRAILAVEFVGAVAWGVICGSLDLSLAYFLAGAVAIAVLSSGAYLHEVTK